MTMLEKIERIIPNGKKVEVANGYYVSATRRPGNQNKCFYRLSDADGISTVGFKSAREVSDWLAEA